MPQGQDQEDRLQARNGDGRDRPHDEQREVAPRGLKDRGLATTLAPLHYRRRQYWRPRSGHRRLFPVKKGLNLSSSTKSDSLWRTTEFPFTSHTCTSPMDHHITTELWTVGLEALTLDSDVVDLFRDAQVAVTFVNRMGSTSSWILDTMDETPLEAWDFGLKPKVVEDLKQRWFHPAIDVFASSRYHACKD